MLLPSPARYAPWSKGVYEVAPALRPFGSDFGNGDLDQQAFQFDRECERYLENKRSALSRRHLHVGRCELSTAVERAAVDWIRERLRIEQPALDVPTEASLDELALLIPEDLCLVSTDGERDWISYVNVGAPSHWDPSTKLGLSFFDGHQVVPGFERINRGARGLVEAMVHKGPWVRFVWGLETDDRLNHHPIPPEGADPREWDGRQFDTKPFLVRFERQLIWGLPEVQAALFLIRVGFVPGEEVRNDPALRDGVLSMSPEARRYKGLDREFEGLIRQFS